MLWPFSSAPLFADTMRQKPVQRPRGLLVAIQRHPRVPDLMSIRFVGTGTAQYDET